MDQHPIRVPDFDTISGLYVWEGSTLVAKYVKPELGSKSVTQNELLSQKKHAFLPPSPIGLKRRGRKRDSVKSHLRCMNT